MKIGFAGLDLPEGKVKYNDPRFKALVEKCKPKKQAPYYVEFLKDEFVFSEAIVMPKASVLDLLIIDIEKMEQRLERAEGEEEKAFLKRCTELLESETPLCDGEFSDDEKQKLKALGCVSSKPVALLDDTAVDVTAVIEKTLEKAGVMFFFTAGPGDVYAWPIAKGSDIVACATRIHTELGKSFIKGEIASFEDFMACHNWNECVRKGLVKIVDRGAVVPDGSVIEVRSGMAKG